MNAMINDYRSDKYNSTTQTAMNLFNNADSVLPPISPISPKGSPAADDPLAPPTSNKVSSISGKKASQV